jgi:HK97 gp10 family phage protein
MAELNINGLAELQAALARLPKAIEQNILRGALVAGAQPILADAKAGAAVASGLMRDGLKVSTSVIDGVLTASIKATGKHAYLAKFVEFGTAAHRIDAKNGSALAFGGGVFNHVQSPGQRARPFLRPAFDAQSAAAIKATAEYINKQLEAGQGTKL